MAMGDGAYSWGTQSSFSFMSRLLPVDPNMVSAMVEIVRISEDGFLLEIRECYELPGRVANDDKRSA
jgi:hypothetical protein